MDFEAVWAEFVELAAVGDEEPAVTLEEFFAPAFMREHTSFATFAEFREQSPWAFEDRTDLDEVPPGRLDDYVARTTEFQSWVAMRNAAAERAVVERLMV